MRYTNLLTYLLTYLLKDNVRRTNTREKRLWKTKNDVLGLVIEDGGR